MIHQARLCRRLADARERPKLDALLQAMVLVASRYAGNGYVVQDPARLRTWVVSNAMDCMSVESLQAMIMVAFYDVRLLEPPMWM